MVSPFTCRCSRLSARSCRPTRIRAAMSCSVVEALPFSCHVNSTWNAFSCGLGHWMLFSLMHIIMSMSTPSWTPTDTQHEVIPLARLSRVIRDGAAVKKVGVWVAIDISAVCWALELWEYTWSVLVLFLIRCIPCSVCWEQLLRF